MNNSGKRTARPPVREARLIDGIYVEVRNKGSKDKGIKIRCSSKKELESLIQRYNGSKDVIVLGEFKNNKNVSHH